MSVSSISRRQFLKTSALVVAGVHWQPVLRPLLRPPNRQPAMRQLRLVSWLN